MSFFDDLKNNRDKQIMAISIVFFVLAFPIYFGLSAAGVDDVGSNQVKMYKVAGEETYIELASGDEFIEDGTPLVLDNLHTDAIDDADEFNIVGVRLTLSYTEAEDISGATCAAPGASGSPADDTITGTTMHGEYNATNSGSNNADSGTHVVESYWINESMINAIVNKSEVQIISEVDAGDRGLGSYMAEISVEANAGNAPAVGCQRSDAGEDVTYKVELIIFEYEIDEYVEPEESDDSEV